MGDVTAIFSGHKIGLIEGRFLVGLARTVYHCTECPAVAVFVNDDRKWFDTFEALKEYLQETEGDLMPA